MPTATPHYALSMPTPGGDENTWGGDLNSNMITKVDNHLARHGLPRTTPSPSAGVITLDLSTHRVFVFTVGENLTVNISNFPTVEPTNPFVRFWIIVTTSASFSLSWNAAFVWDNVNRPFFQTSGTFVIECFATAAGTIYSTVQHRTKDRGSFPMVQAINSGNQLITADGPAAFTFTSADVDTHAVSGVGMFNVASPTRLTVLSGQDGLYRFRARAKISPMSTDNLVLSIRKDGASLLATEWLRPPELSVNFDVVVTMAAGQYVEFIGDVGDPGTENYTIEGGSGQFLSFFGERLQ